MQYILTEEEYNRLKSIKQEKYDSAKRKIEKFCHHVADNLPVLGWWNEVEGTPDPWGCVYTKIALDKSEPDGYVDEYYCDECPSRHICPSNQHYSK